MCSLGPGYALDSTVEFRLQPNENGILRIAGYYQLDANSLLVLGIPLLETGVQPEGFNRSEAGFYFRYLSGTGEKERFEFDLPWEGSNEVNLFLKRWYTNSEIFFEIDGKSFSDYVFIQGSCVSRDLFELDRLKLAGYRARSSFASISSAPLQFDESALQQNPSDFQRRMVEGDLAKTDSKLAAAAPGNVVIVDLIDERLPVYECPSGVYTFSPEYQKTAIDLGGREVDPFSEQYFELFEAGWRKFVSELEEKVVLLNPVFWATHCEDGTELPDQGNIDRQNQKLERLYTAIQRMSPAVHLLEYDLSDFVAATDHKWGRSPFHFSPTFNSLSADKLSRFVAEVASYG